MMSRVGVILMLALAGCAFAASGEARDPAAVNPQDWRFANGRAPSGIEYSAVVAACRDGTISGAEGKPLEACFAQLGLRRAE
jgi:hypothetical protein